MRVAKRIDVEGIVQGVGFRPFVYRCAQQTGLKGYVANDRDGVYIVAEGTPDTLDSFVRMLREQAPPLSRIMSVCERELPIRGFDSFYIAKSESAPERTALISPDVTVCADCYLELFDPEDRRYRHPFINCTNCGPRFTIIQDVPYDRPNTTMAVFPMCPECATEYADPANRRFHAQPNACSVCGPQLSLQKIDGGKIQSDDVPHDAADLLRAGNIIALKGIGGFHLACNALDNAVVLELRTRKNRIDKPFAVMVPDPSWIYRIAEPTTDELTFLALKERPIVLMKRKEGSPVSEHAAPYNTYLGIMLPYTPLHYLILQDVRMPLIMTSGNISEEPIVYRNEDAFERLRGIADYLVTHNRDIHIRCDDSVGMVVNRRRTLLRRSRGYVPYPVSIGSGSHPPILAVGGHLKNTFCLLRKNHAFLSHHIGDLENYETLRSFTEGVEHFKNLFAVSPEIIAYDMHPRYLSTQYALAQTVSVRIPVQHHHAHVASCMAEHGLDQEVLGIAFDGTGYGPDDTIWGGEFLLASRSDFRRFARLDTMFLPGSDEAVREPWRAALSLLYSVYGENTLELNIPFILRIMSDYGERPGIIMKMMNGRINSPLTSAAGRWFDGFAALCGIRQRVNYEAQAAIEFQMCADHDAEGSYDYDVDTSVDPCVVRFGRTIEAVVQDLNDRTGVSRISGKFHNTLSSVAGTVAEVARERSGISAAVLTGGVFQNQLLLGKSIRELERRGFEVYTHSMIPPNDGGLSLGQAAVALERAGRGLL